MLVLDVLCRKRNLTDYTGDYIADTLIENCIAEAKVLLRDVEAWLRKHQPDQLDEE